MPGFQGADVDGLDRTAQTMLDASEAATAVATALQAIVAALEAMSWTGFAAALAAYLKGVVIPWVKATAAALKAFGQILQLASSSQRETSGDRPVVTTGGGSYQTPQLPTVSAANGPTIATIEIRITNGQTGQGSGVQVTTPTLPGQVTATPLTSGGTGAGVAPTTPVATPGGSGLSTGAPSGSSDGATTPSAPSPVTVGSGSLGSGSGSGSGATGGAGAAGAGTGSSGWGGSIGVTSRPDGGLDVQGSFHGTIGATRPAPRRRPCRSRGTPVSAVGSPAAATPPQAPERASTARSSRHRSASPDWGQPPSVAAARRRPARRRPAATTRAPRPPPVLEARPAAPRRMAPAARPQAPPPARTAPAAPRVASPPTSPVGGCWPPATEPGT
ncbi:hypothetical protein [Pedococcus dokdonensis]|uniref:hypothetical protein n=1 Tax=Pedococcus dokdonensis TaxID=443156 RepID=UPI000A429689|nr:hypothetical protein [Pedococcus dokdonensis]